MRVLLDTHLLLWSLAAPARLPVEASRIIRDADVYVSAASIWEIGINVALGQLRADPQEILAALEPAGFLGLPISGEHAARVATLPPIHRDPFDRLLVAQARVEPMHLLTDDAVLGAYGEIVIVV